MVDADYIQDIFSSLGHVTVRRMFGGGGIYFDGTFFALCDEGVIYLKADDELVPDLQKAGSSPFTYTGKSGKQVAMSYWRLPEHLYDDRDELVVWAKRSLAAARRASKPKARLGDRAAKAKSKAKAKAKVKAKLTAKTKSPTKKRKA